MTFFCKATVKFNYGVISLLNGKLVLSSVFELVHVKEVIAIQVLMIWTTVKLIMDLIASLHSSFWNEYK